MSTDVNDASDGKYQVPADWGADRLADFIEAARQNTLATFSNLRAQYDDLLEIHGSYQRIIENLTQHPEFVAAFFLFRTHSCYLGAVRLSLSGQLAEAYMVLRGCLESALYGLYVAGDTNRQEIWLRRHDDDDSRHRVQNEFAIRNVMNHLQSIDSNTQGIAQRLYNHTIDYGGHPNERAVLTQVQSNRQGSRVNFSLDYFVCNGVPLPACLRATAQVGICCLDILYSVFRDRYRILGIDQRLNQLRQRF